MNFVIRNMYFIKVGSIYEDVFIIFFRLGFRMVIELMNEFDVVWKDEGISGIEVYYLFCCWGMIKWL